jgi:hypothetical protein
MACGRVTGQGCSVNVCTVNGQLIRAKVDNLPYHQHGSPPNQGHGTHSRHLIGKGWAHLAEMSTLLGCVHSLKMAACYFTAIRRITVFKECLKCLCPKIRKLIIASNSWALNHVSARCWSIYWARVPTAMLYGWYCSHVHFANKESEV